MFFFFEKHGLFYCLDSKKNGGNQNGKRNNAYLFPFEDHHLPQGQYGFVDNPIEITPAEAVAYEDAILATIAKENRFFKNDRGLAEYIHDETLNKKVYSLYPSMEIVDGELWGVMTAGLKEDLSGEETAELLNFVTGRTAMATAKVLNSVPSKLRTARYTSVFGIMKTIP